MKNLSIIFFVLLLTSCYKDKDEVEPSLNCETQRDAVDVWLKGDWTVGPNVTGIDSLFFRQGQYTVENCGKRVQIQSRSVFMEVNSYQANSASIKLYYFGTTTNTVINRIR